MNLIETLISAFVNHLVDTFKWSFVKNVDLAKFQSSFLLHKGL